MREVKWNEPIEIGFLQGSTQIVSGPSEALNCLANLWPELRGPHYVAARSICRAAIDGRKSAEEARAVFISATREARLKAH